MDDREIVAQFWARSESAIRAVGDRYGGYCRVIATNILGDDGDAEEVLNDTYLRVWNAIPPARPDNLRAFVAKIARNLALNRLEASRAQKRGGGQVDLILSELDECIADRRSDPDAVWESARIADAIGRFLAAQSVQSRRIFVRRYWAAAGIEDIAAQFHLSVGTVKSSLFRTRKKLRAFLEKEKIV